MPAAAGCVVPGKSWLFPGDLTCRSVLSIPLAMRCPWLGSKSWLLAPHFLPLVTAPSAGRQRADLHRHTVRQGATRPVQHLLLRPHQLVTQRACMAGSQPNSIWPTRPVAHVIFALNACTHATPMYRDQGIMGLAGLEGEVGTLSPSCGGCWVGMSGGLDGWAGRSRLAGVDSLV